MDRIRLANKVTSHGVLFLQGVYKKDCKNMEDIFQDRLMSEINTRQIKIYDKIPNIFTGLDSWPKRTNLKCWYCDRTFKNRPWFEPQSIEPRSIGNIGKIIPYSELLKSVNKKSVSIIPRGVFCTCNCVRAYINTYTKDISYKHDKVAMLLYVYEIFTSKKIPDIQASPEKVEMVQYGGNLSPIDYQNKINMLDEEYIQELEDNNFSNICNIYLHTMTND